LNITAQQSYTGATIIKGGTVRLTSAANVAGFGTDTNGAPGANSTWKFNDTTPESYNATAVTNNVLTLTDGNGGEGRSAWANKPVSINAPFTVSFVYKANGQADGAAFVLQNDPNNTSAIGSPGGSLAYSGTDKTTPGIMPSVGVGFNIYGTAGLLELSGGTVGDPGTTGSVNVGSGDPIQVTLAYDGSGSIGVTLLDVGNGNTYSTIDFLSSSIASILGSNTAYMGFTGASGGLTAVQTISGFGSSLTYSTSNILPAGTALTVAAGSTLDLNGAGQQVASLSGAGTIRNAGNVLSALVVGDSSSTTYSGSITKLGGSDISLTKVGDGKLVLSGSNDFTGGTSVTGGTLTVTNVHGLADGSNLAVGDPSLLSLLPDATIPSPVVASAAVSPVPEPGTLALLAAGVVAAAFGVRRRKGIRRLV
jgi:autotransporter-associated beta strand protein